MESCFHCDGEMKNEYQEMLYTPDLRYVKCCSEKCAKYTLRLNADILYDRYNIIKNQCIQRLK
nr:hypothetical protein [Clostridioides sp.]